MHDKKAPASEGGRYKEGSKATRSGLGEAALES